MFNENRIIYEIVRPKNTTTTTKNEQQKLVIFILVYHQIDWFVDWKTMYGPGDKTYILMNGRHPKFMNNSGAMKLLLLLLLFFCVFLLLFCALQKFK
jgi:hypothetical protein